MMIGAQIGAFNHQHQGLMVKRAREAIELPVIFSVFGFGKAENFLGDPPVNSGEF